MIAPYEKVKESYGQKLGLNTTRVTKEQKKRKLGSKTDQRVLLADWALPSERKLIRNLTADATEMVFGKSHG